MRYGSVCSGIEAATVAWHPLGWEPAWFSEIDPFPSRVLAHHYPGVRNYGDFTRIRADAGPIDLLVGGTPCQAFSIAGLRGGLNDERGNLALEYCRLTDRLRPRWVVWENVPGVLSSNGGRDFGSILGALVDLGYGVAYRVLDAQYVGGCEMHGDPFIRGPVPQRRRRVFVVGYLGDWRRAAAVLFERSSMQRDPPSGCEARKAAARGAERRTPGGSIPSVAGTLGGGSGNRGWAPDTDRMTFIPQTTHTLRAEGFDASEDGTGRGTPLIAAPRVYGRKNTSGPISTAAALTAKGGCGRMDFASESFVLGFHHTQDPIGGDVSPALGATTDGMGILAAHAVRRLTPLECERLQGFPDGYTAIPGAADGPRYRALGNSMAVPVMRWIGERIARVEAIPIDS
jgi:DNA (cytosine-5)-methyltransferase 1